jgi:16S rRNA (guanine527-N7)-methyltransferase
LSPLEHLRRDAALLGVSVTEADATRLLVLLDELERWNRSYNLTAVSGREALISHHLLDSLSIHADLAGICIADVGTGAGFPGLPLALLNPDRRFTLIDSNGKKTRFVAHAARVLDLTNVTVLHARSETLTSLPPFDTVVVRALAPLPKLLTLVAPLCAAATRVLAMKGQWPAEELAQLPAGWNLTGSRRITVPGLDAERCVLTLTREGAAAAPSSP